ncbi:MULTISPECIES: molecular chaperone HtpG [Prochlorococcus]|uniref:HSP90 family molecular chaperone n=1 Tax=Prochlorococcus marinus (strain SARG / CCMP1375 / SS120) TaxID=167539 RepID=Q7VC08_PROMA|nr:MULTISPECIES: molecular chaperone HtpG [Prochlorococcus]AAP99978.1 HSP90 family molecular chaperone [Prochlorococcus marinus subsp. marinus str. CCMP1375]KGG13776.1 Chaperone protein HtpG [Prochlorococcus marinus str. LG]KGG18911.1 Chaperone protein HtpG [Prochlorococcus marinus str. SS2]KGG23551.1 Chaperone protein HtpG [Prochlorococcus marinus str. SS35]KGG32213.1 Chaperone protein HtpG [Prochlorococcus marinus str. SS51]
MTVIEEGQIQIHTENIFPIIKKAVYSDHEIFLRELVSNGVDAISKRRMASIAGDCEPNEEAKIEINIDREKSTITFSDNGIGMSSDEVKKYINQVAFSSAQEFLQKYEKEQEGIIGHFGLGFYSSFMVANKVEIITKSAKEGSTAVKWSCDGSPNFSLTEIEREEAGTDIILYLMQEEIEYIEPARIKTLIKKYCDFMPVDVQFSGESINRRNPPWRTSPQDMQEKDYIELYKYLYPFQGDPLFWIHLNTDYPYNLQGILFFPKISGRADWESGEIKLYSNHVFVSDSVKDVVPRFLLPLRGVIDSTDIPLNVSRSALQSNKKVRSISNFISKKIADKLKVIRNDDSNFYCQIWDSISPFIKIGAMEDEKFAEQVEDLIIFQSIKQERLKDEETITNSDNTVYTIIQEYVNRIQTEENKKIIYCTDEISQANALALWKDLGKEIIIADTVIDSQFIPWIESKLENISFQRVDAEIDEDTSDKSPELKDIDGESKSDILKELIEQSLDNKNITVQVKSLKSNSDVPAMILLPEQMRRINDMGALMDQKLPGLPDNHILLINKNHPMVEGLSKLKASSIIVGTEGKSQNEELIKQIALHLYEMACLGIGGLDPTKNISFQKRSAELVGTLLGKIV